MFWPEAKTVSRCPHKGKRVSVKVVDVYDGDTCTILLPISDTFLKPSVRVNGVDTPELRVARPKSDDPDYESKLRLRDLHVKAGKLVRDVVSREITDRVLSCDVYKWDKYGGRIIADLIVGEQTLGERLLALGLAKPYSGARKEKWSESELEQVIEKATTILR